MAEEQKISSSELALVTQLITERVDSVGASLNARFDRLEQEVKPKLDEHATAIVEMRTERDVERRWRKWTPPVSGATVVAIVEGLKHLLGYVKGHL